MPWTRKFPEPIKLKDGRKIATLGQARELMLALPERHQSRPFWQYAAQLLIEAAERGDRASVDHAAAQLSRAWRPKGWSDAPRRHPIRPDHPGMPLFDRRGVYSVARLQRDE
jgi:hypothetical protein